MHCRNSKGTTNRNWRTTGCEIPTKRSTISAVETIFPRTCLEIRWLRRLLNPVSEFTTETEVLLYIWPGQTLFSSSQYIAGIPENYCSCRVTLEPSTITSCNLGSCLNFWAVLYTAVVRSRLRCHDQLVGQCWRGVPDKVCCGKSFWNLNAQGNNSRSQKKCVAEQVLWRRIMRWKLFWALLLFFFFWKGIPFQQFRFIGWRISCLN